MIGLLTLAECVLAISSKRSAVCETHSRNSTRVSVPIPKIRMHSPRTQIYPGHLLLMICGIGFEVPIPVHCARPRADNVCDYDCPVGRIAEQNSAGFARIRLCGFALNVLKLSHYVQWFVHSGVVSENGPQSTLSQRGRWNPPIERRQGYAEVLGYISRRDTTGQQLLC